MYGYQPGIIRVPTLDSAHRGEVGASIGPTVLPHGSLYVNYTLKKNLFVGAQTSVYYRHDDTNSDDLFFHSRGYRDYLRSGLSSGLNGGTYFQSGPATVYLQAGSDLEYVHRSYTEINDFQDRSGVYRKATPSAKYTANAYYLKPWLQLSARITDRPGPWKAALTLGLRTSFFKSLDPKATIQPLNNAPIDLSDHPLPGLNYLLVQGTVGADVRVARVILSMRLQTRLYSAGYDFSSWWYSPLLYGNVGITYPFGQGR